MAKRTLHTAGCTESCEIGVPVNIGEALCDRISASFLSLAALLLFIFTAGSLTSAISTAVKKPNV